MKIGWSTTIKRNINTTPRGMGRIIYYCGTKYVNSNIGFKPMVSTGLKLWEKLILKYLKPTNVLHGIFS